MYKLCDFFSPEKASAEEKEEDTREEQSSEPRPRALHRTMSIFLRNLAPSITKQEVEAVSSLHGEDSSSRSKRSIGHILGLVGPIDIKLKGSVSVGYWVNYVVTLTFDITLNLEIRFIKVKFWNSCISGIVGLIDVKRKES